MQNKPNKIGHPYPPHIVNGAKALIVGTFPPPRFEKDNKDLSCSDVDFYYGSRDNYFWDIISKVYNVNFTRGTQTAEEERKEFLDKHQIGICDILKVVEREEPLNASDKSLEPIEYLDIATLLAENNKIKALYVTSDIVKKYVVDSLKIYGHYSNQYYTTVKDRKFTISINGTPYTVYVLPSPSPRNTMSFSKKVKIYKELLLEKLS